MRQILEALRYCHDNNVIHRDVKVRLFPCSSVCLFPSVSVPCAYINAVITHVIMSLHTFSGWVSSAEFTRIKPNQTYYYRKGLSVIAQHELAVKSLI